ncbi:hypothetical protein CBR_g3205 [Chara braunii]|uniref:Uncharacterized protein n=1 Tax=Chara braunii TaxID=69332 RepID=A0A388KF29_CHABU|nr:hypothetical protein CBR_g3205 [Chara braunii]|eukprot:GBG68664.1 hypothetical protein CBR_g3205 [Chara braunii]
MVAQPHVLDLYSDSAISGNSCKRGRTNKSNKWQKELHDNEEVSENDPTFEMHEEEENFEELSDADETSEGRDETSEGGAFHSAQDSKEESNSDQAHRGHPTANVEVTNPTEESHNDEKRGFDMFHKRSLGRSITEAKDTLTQEVRRGVFSATTTRDKPPYNLGKRGRNLRVYNKKASFHVDMKKAEEVLKRNCCKAKCFRKFSATYVYYTREIFWAMKQPEQVNFLLREMRVTSYFSDEGQLEKLRQFPWLVPPFTVPSFSSHLGSDSHRSFPVSYFSSLSDDRGCSRGGPGGRDGGRLPGALGGVEEKVKCLMERRVEGEAWQAGGVRAGVGGRRPHGQGTLLYADGSMYKGDWQHGICHGKGEWKDAISGIFYAGMFENGKRKEIPSYLSVASTAAEVDRRRNVSVLKLPANEQLLPDIFVACALPVPERKLVEGNLDGVGEEKEKEEKEEEEEEEEHLPLLIDINALTNDDANDATSGSEGEYSLRNSVQHSLELLARLPRVAACESGRTLAISIHIGEPQVIEPVTDIGQQQQQGTAVAAAPSKGKAKASFTTKKSRLRSSSKSKATTPTSSKPGTPRGKRVNPFAAGRGPSVPEVEALQQQVSFGESLSFRVEEGSPPLLRQQARTHKGVAHFSGLEMQNAFEKRGTYTIRIVDVTPAGPGVDIMPQQWIIAKVQDGGLRGSTRGGGGSGAGTPRGRGSVRGGGQRGGSRTPRASSPGKASGKSSASPKPGSAGKRASDQRGKSRGKL